ncbi:MAG: FAD-dependent monooxygenase, partial [Hyphomicrobiaceae bacterium]
MLSGRPILIAGAGIGGLAAALALARHGFRSHILEQSAAPVEAGAGIQIGPNGTRLLADLGVLEALRPHAVRPDTLDVFDGGSGALLTRLPLGAWLSARHGADYLTAHRADVHGALIDAVSQNECVALTGAFRVLRFADTAQEVRVCSDAGAEIHGSALIGADGVWSTVRSLMFGGAALRPTGKTAARALIPIARVPPAFAAPAVGVWMGRRAHVVHYPVRGGAMLAMVVVTADDWTG